MDARIFRPLLTRYPDLNGPPDSGEENPPGKSKEEFAIGGEEVLVSELERSPIGAEDSEELLETFFLEDFEAFFSKGLFLPFE